MYQVHKTSGHNDPVRTNQCLTLLYYWEELCKDVNAHVKQCIKCRQQNPYPQHYAQLYLEVSSLPMHFSIMDLISTFKSLPQRHQYALTVIDMLNNCTWCILLYTKEADKVMHAYLFQVYSKFGRSHKMFWDNGTEFKNKLFVQVASTFWKETGIQYIGNVHNFLEKSIWKYVSWTCMEWSGSYACAAYNFIPNEHSEVSAIFPVFWWNACTSLVQLLNPKLRNVSNDKNFLSLDALRYLCAGNS